MLKISKVLTTLAILTISSGCATSIPVEGPLCLPTRPVLEEITRQEQLDIRDQVSADVLRRIGTNDLSLKSHIRVLEGTIRAHDEPLGSCE
jgi:hypothetical protein